MTADIRVHKNTNLEKQFIQQRISKEDTERLSRFYEDLKKIISSMLKQSIRACGVKPFLDFSELFFETMLKNHESSV